MADEGQSPGSGEENGKDASDGEEGDGQHRKAEKEAPQDWDIEAEDGQHSPDPQDQSLLCVKTDELVAAIAEEQRYEAENPKVAEHGIDL